MQKKSMGWENVCKCFPSLLEASGCHMAAGRNLKRSDSFPGLPHVLVVTSGPWAITISVQLLARLPGGRTAMLSVGSNRGRVVISTPYPLPHHHPHPPGQATGPGEGTPQLNSKKKTHLELESVFHLAAPQFLSSSLPTSRSAPCAGRTRGKAWCCSDVGSSWWHLLCGETCHSTAA